MNLGLDGRRTVLVGAGSDLGRACAGVLEAEGARVVRGSAALVAFLCSQQGDRVTGQSIPVNGGGSRHL